MIKKIILIILIISFLNIKIYATNTQTTNSGEFLNNNLTIKELSKNIEKLNQEKIILKNKIKELSKEYGELISFIKEDLSNKEKNEIKTEVQNYIEKKENIENELNKAINNFEDTSKIKKDLILQKANFYKFLSKYVEKSKRNEFIEHIKFNIQITKESKDLIEEITRNQNLFDQKINFIKNKIDTHQQELQTKIENVLISKINQKIKEIDENEKYKFIDTETKNNIYNDFINTINERLQEIEKSNLTPNYKEMRINILTKIIQEIQSKIK